MVKKYKFGKHFNTDAVVVDIKEDVAENLPYFRVLNVENEIVFKGLLSEGDRVYGLGENSGRLNRIGKIYINYNTDNSFHSLNSKSMYGSHNFFVLDGKTKYGFFFDSPGRVVFDMARTNRAVIDVSVQNAVTLYVLTGDTVYGIVKEFLQIIGKSFVPPLWAFGFMQSRWGYKNERDIREVVEGYKKAGIPIDSVCMDIDYMDRYMDFTVNKKRFPDLAGFVHDMKAQGIKLVPIIDAGVKAKKGYSVDDEGIKLGYFCLDKNGKPFEGAVWPGFAHFPDFLRPEVRKWFGEKFKFLTDMGLDGFWIDMNEPSIFFTRDDLKKFMYKFNKIPGEDGRYETKGVRTSNYKGFYHNADGINTVHHDVHNMYGYEMARSAGEYLNTLPQRYLLFSRSSYIGSHRYGGIWTGDNASNWENLEIFLKQLPSLNMCGLQYVGSDIGGFSLNTTRELLLRWLALGVFTPLMRNHAANTAKHQECYLFENLEDFRSVIGLRYMLLPYIYSEYVKAVLSGEPLVKPLAFMYSDDKIAVKCEDELMFGNEVIIAPFYKKGEKTRKVYLPEDMLQIDYAYGKLSETKVSKGEHLITADVGEVVFFIRDKKCIPIGVFCRNTEELDYDKLKLFGNGKEYKLYKDDGYTKNISKKNIVIMKK